eukprot:10100282-Lingulodinium_polyedra.AAC.1
MLRKKPAGLLLAWLQTGGHYSSREEYIAGRSEIGKADFLPARQAARAWLYEQQGDTWDALRALEGPSPQEEPASIR